MSLKKPAKDWVAEIGFDVNKGRWTWKIIRDPNMPHRIHKQGTTKREGAAKRKARKIIKQEFKKEKLAEERQTTRYQLAHHPFDGEYYLTEAPLPEPSFSKVKKRTKTND